MTTPTEPPYLFDERVICKILSRIDLAWKAKYGEDSDSEAEREAKPKPNRGARPQPEPSPLSQRVIAELHKKPPASNKAIAALVGCSEYHVGWWRRRLGLPSAQRGPASGSGEVTQRILAELVKIPLSSDMEIAQRVSASQRYVQTVRLKWQKQQRDGE